MNGLDGCIRNRRGILGVGARTSMDTIKTILKREHTSLAVLSHVIFSPLGSRLAWSSSSDSQVR